MSSQDENFDSSVIDLRKLDNRRLPPTLKLRRARKSAAPEEKRKAATPEKGKTLLSWQAPEFEKYEKSRDWFLVFGIGVVVLVVVSLVARAFLPAITFILLGAVIFIFSKKPPRDIKFAIRKDGVLIDNKLYEWSNLDSFWIFYKPGEPKILSLRSKKPIMPYIHLPLGSESPIGLRRVMMKYLPEEEQEESVIDEMARRLKF